ncbi:GumC family protein [Bizionia sp. KMM 8389]
MYNQIETESENEQLDIQGLVYRYLTYWPWILVSALIMTLSAFLYLRYIPNSYTTTAKVKILSDKEASGLSLDLDKILGKGNVNLENERAILNSFRLNRKVVEKLNLQVSYYQTGRVNEVRVFNAPFVATYVAEADGGEAGLEYDITIIDSGYKVVNTNTGTVLEIPSFYFNEPTAEFPFVLAPKDNNTIQPGPNPDYHVRIRNLSHTTQSLLNSIKIAPDGKSSDIITLSLNATDKDYAQSALNTLVEVYTEDGILDRQEVSKRTISFIDERFQYLSVELDSIEVSKGVFKQDNNLSIFEADAASVLQKRTMKDEQLFEVETQVMLAEVLENSITNANDFELLPANIGLSSGAINDLVADYNNAVLEYNKWKTSAGDSNPRVKILKQTITDLNSNISSSLKGYKGQLQQSLKQNQQAQANAQQSFKTLPNKELILRSIERQQLLKENLYLLLLQKREEAAINMAVTSANVKVIDYALTNATPVAPKRQIILLGALILGVLIPIGILYVKFLLDNKIYSGKDVEAINPKMAILGEIPAIPSAKEAPQGIQNNAQAEEAFRTLVHNLNFMQVGNAHEGGHVISVTSSVKGEGKTTVSYNIADTYFQLKKRVLLVGADLRNPQLHPFINVSKDTFGLSNYLSDPDANWREGVINLDKNANNFDMMLSGAIPPMPAVLLASPRFEEFISEARKEYDYVIIDTAPTLLVADTLTFINKTDYAVYVVRSGTTEKKLIEYSKKLVDQNKINKMGYVVNDISHRGAHGYGYNYGYGYGYSADVPKKAWYQFWK